MYLHTENELSRSRLTKVRARTRQTDTQTDATETITTAAFMGGEIVCTGLNLGTIVRAMSKMR